MKSATGEDVHEQLHALMRALKTQMREAMLEGPDPVPPMAVRVLGFFIRNPGSTPSHLSSHTGLDKAQVARLVKDLVEGGYVTRVADPNDGRSRQLTATAKGRGVQKRMDAQRERIGHILLTGLSRDERTQLSSLLRRLSDNLAKAAATS